ncbi:MAG: HNH endonuclease, partial [Paraclostridium sp.]
NNCGYHRVSACSIGKRLRFFRHRIVAKLFLDNPNDYVVVNHIDGNKNNNHMLNLEWCTHQENEMHKQKFLSPKKTNKPFLVYTSEGDLYGTYKSQNDFIDKNTNVSQSSLSRWLIKGFCTRGFFKNYKFVFQDTVDKCLTTIESIVDTELSMKK